MQLLTIYQGKALSSHGVFPPPDLLKLERARMIEILCSGLEGQMYSIDNPHELNLRAYVDVYRRFIQELAGRPA